MAAGHHDGDLRRWARSVRDARVEVVIRYGHEMNGFWYPWGTGRGADPVSVGADFVAAWNHARDIFVEEGARNARWMWSPNISFPGSGALTNYWPGAGNVDLVGVSGYNHGTVQGSGRWITPTELFGSTLDEISALTDMDVTIAETASAQRGGDRTAWITELGRLVRSRSQVNGVVWFSVDKERDWRLSAADARTLREALGR